ncbi:S41 family peptidase [Chryseosolibacter indicus]|uniref:PDZ domain-containing protein n=1 Tax=Chryseosolibacter indicus TaxID=2782351 RepID=A0ABS5W2L5_9BACT|nr:S41 family peptidase [Chryseosolibacter indicus]MBT1706501.1 PDZ domain-containing protein [Chryseosolibacter indicus]
MQKINFRSKLSLIGFVALLFLAGCKDDDPAPSNKITNEDNAYVNNWIYKEMKTWYLWKDKLPPSPDVNAEPEEFLDQLLYSEDRFTWIQDNYVELLNALKGVTKEAGYEFVLYRENASSNNVIAQILYVKPSSPAENAGLKRGDIITHINGQQITTSNYSTLLDQIGQNHTIEYKPIDPENKQVGDPASISLTTVQYAEDPNYLSKVIEVDGGRRVGYFVYNLFADGPDSETKTYNDEMDNAFNSFKSADITDLVLDLRFNSGGSETSAKNLASLIGSGVGSSKVFAKKEYNDVIQEQIIKDKDLGPDFLTSKFADKAQNVGSMLTGNRVYILTSSRTASASELVINSLKPYMDVFIIGDTTYGKNVGSISLYEEEDPKNKWGLQPIVVKVFNSLNQSDYGNGFVPNIVNKDNTLFLFPLGDPREALLSQAIAQITGIPTISRSPKPEESKTIVGHSLDRKRRSFNLIIDQE